MRDRKYWIEWLQSDPHAVIEVSEAARIICEVWYGNQTSEFRLDRQREIAHDLELRHGKSLTVAQVKAEMDRLI